VSVGAAPPPPGPPEQEPDPQDPNEGEEPDEQVNTINILPVLLKRLPDWTDVQSKRMVRLVKEDEDSRKVFMDRRANQLRLIAGAIPNLGYPAEGAKAPHIAIMTKAILHLWARIFDQVIPAKGDIVHAAPMPGQDDSQIKVERHMNFQLRRKMPDWSSSHQVSIFSWLTSGSLFRHYRFDPVEQVHRVDYCPIDDIIISYTEHDDHPLMKTVERVTRVLRLERWRAEVYASEGMFSNLEAIYPPEDDEEDSASTASEQTVPRPDTDSEVQKAVIEIGGVDPPERGDKDGKREYLEIHTRLTFPKDIGIEGLAGLNKPVIFTIDRKSKKPVGLTIREEPDPVDQSRYDQAMTAFKIASENVAKQEAMGQPARPPTQPRPVRSRTMYHFIHYRLFPNTDGFYGLGVGYLLEGANELANSLAAEYMLSAKFANLQGGWMARGTKAKRGDVQIPMGKWIETELEPEVLAKALLPHQFSPPSEGLMHVVDKLESNSEIAANADVLSGEKGASNETAAGAKVRNSNAMALISVMTRLYLEPMKYEVQMIAHGNSVQMTGPETFPHSTPGVERDAVEQITVTPQDYANEMHFEFTADARMSSKPERIQDAMNALDRILNSPLKDNVMLVDFATRKVWRAMESPDYEAAMGPPPQPPPPPTPLSQDSENAGFFNEQDHPVLPDDNHMGHLHTIEQLKKSPLFEKMSSTGKQILDRHERAHTAHFYMQMQELQKHTGVDVHGSAGGAGGPAGMAGGPGNGPVPGGMGGGAPGGPPPGAPGGEGG
jgi:hypothetical protein